MAATDWDAFEIDDGACRQRRTLTFGRLASRPDSGLREDFESGFQEDS